MEFHQRKLLSINRFLSDCYYNCEKLDKPKPHKPSKDDPNKSHHLSPVLIFMFCVIGAAFLFMFYLAIFQKYRSTRNNSRTANPPQVVDDDREEFIDENHGPVLDNPVWYINTIGLQQSVIDSIAVFKYKRGEVLTEGTECSVCLNEFREDETLRLLPKCSHAFHVPCIDTWLRSHKNCPLCRAPIVSESNGDPASVSGPNSDDLEVNLESSQVGEDGTSQMRDGEENSGLFSNEGEIFPKLLERNSQHFNEGNSGFRVFSDLGDHSLKVEEDLVPKRRSISMDSSSASKIYLAMAVANNLAVENEGCSSTKSVQVKTVNSEIAGKRANVNSSIYRSMKSSTFGRSFQKRPITMKRSFSSTGNRFFSRSQDSRLPL